MGKLYLGNVELGGGGGTLYQHNITIFNGSGSGTNYTLNYVVKFKIISSSSDKLDTITKIKTFYESVKTDIPINYSDFSIEATGAVNYNSSGTWYSIISINQFTVAGGSDAFYVTYINSASSKNPLNGNWYNVGSVVDMVIEIK